MSAASAVSLPIEASSGQDMAAEAERSPKSTTSLLLATDACCQAEHVIAEAERGAGAMPVVVCITCTVRWEHREGLRSWQERYPGDFAEAYPHGLTDHDLGITARPAARPPPGGVCASDNNWSPWRTDETDEPC